MIELMGLTDNVTPITQGVTFAVVGGFITILTLVLTNRSKRDSEMRTAQAVIDKEMRDYAREDLVAERLEAATKAVAKEAKSIAKETHAVSVQVGQVERLGKVTHALVNSDKTNAMRERRDNLITTMILMQEVIDLKTQAGTEPSREALEQIESMRNRIIKMEADIDERLRQQESAERANDIIHNSNIDKRAPEKETE